MGWKSSLMGHQLYYDYRPSYLKQSHGDWLTASAITYYILGYTLAIAALARNNSCVKNHTHFIALGLRKLP